MKKKKKNNWLVELVDDSRGTDRCCWDCDGRPCVVDGPNFGAGTDEDGPGGWGLDCGTGIGAKPGNSGNSL